jgi:toxin ParE1/3/4
LAATDIEDIILYIAAENPQAALNVLDAIEQRFAQLLNYPFSGPSREDIGPGIRHVVSGQYIAFYRIRGEEVDVLRVLHGKRSVDPATIVAS